MVLAALVGAIAPFGALAQDASPAASGVPAASLAPAMSGAPASAAPASAAPETMCDSWADLRSYIGFLQSQSLSEDGILPILVGALASLTEARTLLPLVSDTYQPLVGELISSLQDLVGVAKAGRQGTLGGELVNLGEAVTRVGVALDALSAVLREPCPSGSAPSGTPLAVPFPAASASPGVSGSPAG